MASRALSDYAPEFTTVCNKLINDLLCLSFRNAYLQFRFFSRIKFEISPIIPIIVQHFHLMKTCYNIIG